MILFDRLSSQYPARHGSEVRAWIRAGEEYASTFAELPNGERAALVIIFAAMNLTHSKNEKQAYRSALSALLQPFQPGASI